MSSTDTRLQVATSQASTSSSAATSSSSSSSSSSNTGQMQGRGVKRKYDELANKPDYIAPTNGFSKMFRNGLAWSTNNIIVSELGALVEEYFVDPVVLEPICYEPGMTFATPPKLNHVFLQTIPIQFPQKLQKDRASFGMQNMREIDTSGMLLIFVTRHARDTDAAEQIHKLFGKMVTEFAPRLQTLTLQREFNVTLSTNDYAKCRFDEALLRKYLPQHPKLNIQIVAAPGQGCMTLDLDNHRVGQTFGLGITFASRNQASSSSSSSSAATAPSGQGLQGVAYLVGALIADQTKARAALSNFEVMLRDVPAKEQRELLVAQAVSQMSTPQQALFNTVVEKYKEYLKAPLKGVIDQMKSVKGQAENVENCFQLGVQMSVLIQMQQQNANMPVATSSSSSSFATSK